MKLPNSSLTLRSKLTWLKDITICSPRLLEPSSWRNLTRSKHESTPCYAELTTNQRSYYPVPEDSFLMCLGIRVIPPVWLGYKREANISYQVHLHHAIFNDIDLITSTTLSPSLLYFNMRVLAIFATLLAVAVASPTLETRQQGEACEVWLSAYW